MVFELQIIALEALGVSTQTAQFLTGTLPHSNIASDILGILLSWAFFYLALILYYHTIVPLTALAVRRLYPKAPTARVPKPLIDNMVEVSHAAFPLYVTVPMLCDVFRKKGWSQTCGWPHETECGSYTTSLLACVAYFLSIELYIFLDHYYFLHKFDIGKKLGQHAQHHVYKKADQLNGYSGYAFAPQDGWSQGIPLALFTLVYPVPLAFVYLMEIATGLWTVYIHTDVAPLPWPFMGCDYHYIHHKYNWYNFGFMTLLFDEVFGTVKHPDPAALAESRGEVLMSKPSSAAELAHRAGRHASKLSTD